VIIEASNLSVRYQQANVLEDVSVAIKAGSYVGIVGPNGSGKTTLVKALLGLVQRSSGEIRLCGNAIETFSDWGRIGYLPQLSTVPTHRFPARVDEIVATGLLAGKSFPRRIGRSDFRRVDAVLETLGISELKQKLIGRLSGGQRQRVFLARALVSEPELLFLDEPVVALDPASREAFYDTIARLNRERNVTVLMVSHDLSAMHENADMLLYLDRRVIFFGDAKSFCESEKMTAYLGEGLQHLICGIDHGQRTDVTAG
jgi:zinc transport system ATP-binding protein